MKSVDISLNDRFEQLADEFTQQLRDGQNPEIETVATQNPELASKVRTLFPMLAMMEAGARKNDQAIQQPVASRPTEDLKQLGDYRVIREIGRGGMGIVYEAIQESLNRLVALKLLSIANVDTRSIERFNQEAKLAAMLHHTNIVPIYGTGQQDGHSYFVMQFIEGESLDEVLADLKRLHNLNSKAKTPGPTILRDDISTDGNANNSPSAIIASSLWTRSAHSTPKQHDYVNLDQPSESQQALKDTARFTQTRTTVDGKNNPSSKSSFSQTGNLFWQNIARVGIQAADGLAHAHSQGILHRDIKPSNLILDEAGSLWITDFGLAKLSQSANLTRTGEVVGTLRYMPPEQFSGTSDQRSDIYGLGLTLYEMTTFQSAFQSNDHRRLMAEVIECRPIAPRKINPQIPKDLETIIVKSISLEPEKRYRNANEMSADLKRFLDGQPIKARQVSVAERFAKWTRRHPAIATLSATLVLLTCLGMAGITWKWREADANYREAMRQSQVREVYFSKALEAVDQMLLRVGSDKLANMPRMNQVRKELLQDALQFYTTFLDESDNDPSLRAEIGKVHRRTGDIHRLLSDDGKALTAFQKSYDEFLQLNQQFPDNTDYIKELAAAGSSMATSLLELGKSAEAEEKSVESTQLLSVGLTQISETGNSLQTQRWKSLLADAKYHLGVIQVTTKGIPHALDELKQAKDLFAQLPAAVMSENLRSKHAQCLDALAQIYDTINRLDESITFREQSIAITNALIAEFPEAPNHKNSLARSQQFISGLLARQGRLAEAEIRLRQEIQTRESLVTQFPDIPNLQSDLCRAYAVHGGMLHELGKETQGHAEVLKGIQLAERLNQQYPENVSFMTELGYVTQIMGANLSLSRDPAEKAEAIKYNKQSYDIRKRLVELRPNHEASQIDLATSARNYAAARYYAQDHSPEVFNLIKEAISICQTSYELNPSSTDALYQLAFNQLNLSRMEIEQQVGNPLQTTQAAVAIMKQLIQEQPDITRHYLQVTRAYDQIADLQFRAGELDAWEETLRAANQNMDSVIERFGDDSRLVQFLTISKNRLAHCIKARGHAEEARQLFNQALSYRTATLERALADPNDPTNQRALREAASSYRNLTWLHALFLNELDLNTALEYGLKAVELDAEQPDCWTALAYVHYAKDDAVEMNRALGECTSDGAADQMARYSILALHAWKDQDSEQAWSLLEQARQLHDSEEVQEDILARWLQPELFRVYAQATQTIEDK